MRVWFAALALLIGATAAPGMAAAQLSVTRSPSLAPLLGDTIRGTAVTTFSVSTTGAVTRTSGNAIRITTGSVRAPTITLGCTSNLNNCRTRDIRVTILPINSGSATISRLRISALTNGGRFDGSAPAEAAILQFDIKALGARTTSFDLGMDVRLAASATPGDHDFDYLVVAELQ